MPAWASRSIRLHLALLILGVALPLFGLLVAGFWTDLEQERRSSRVLALRIAHSIADDMRDSNARADALLTRMSARPKVRAGNPADCDALFPIVDFFPQYLNLQLYDPSAQLLCSAEPLPADVPYSRPAESVVRAFIASRRPIPADPMLLAVGSRWLSIAFRTLGASDRPTVLVLLQYLDFNVDAYPAGTVVTVLDRDGRIVARSLDPAHWVGRSGGSNFVNASLSAEGSGELRGVDGVIRQYGFTPVQGTQWRLFVAFRCRWRPHRCGR